MKCVSLPIDCYSISLLLFLGLCQGLGHKPGSYSIDIDQTSFNAGVPGKSLTTLTKTTEPLLFYCRMRMHVCLCVYNELGV